MPFDDACIQQIPVIPVPVQVPAQVRRSERLALQNQESNSSSISGNSIGGLSVGDDKIQCSLCRRIVNIKGFKNHQRSCQAQLLQAAGDGSRRLDDSFRRRFRFGMGLGSIDSSSVVPIIGEKALELVDDAVG